MQLILMQGQISPLMMSKIYLRKALEDCKRTKIRVMKTIRLHVEEILNFPDFKIIVLFRDPRAVMNSIKLSPDFWTEEIHDPNFNCGQMNANFLKIPQNSDKFTILKYEDFISNPKKSIEDIYEFLGISYLNNFPFKAFQKHLEYEENEEKWNEALIKSEKIIQSKPDIFSKKGEKMNFVDFYSHLQDERKRQFFKAKKMNTLVQHGTFRYYSTFRSPNFKPDHWKDEIPPGLLASIENRSSVCRKSLRLLDYP